MHIKILGPGCSRCRTLENNVREAVKELSINAKITKVDDIVDIMNYNIINTPGFVIDEDVVTAGRLLSVTQVKKILNKYQQLNEKD